MAHIPRKEVLRGRDRQEGIDNLICRGPAASLENQSLTGWEGVSAYPLCRRNRYEALRNRKSFLLAC